MHYSLKNYSFLLLILFIACTHKPYKLSGDIFPNPANFIDEPQISRGEPNFIADTLGKYVFSLPEKIILANWKMGSHQISAETEGAIREYLVENDLKEVKVRLNEYAPMGEWKRLVNNEAVGPGWRYTVGVINWLFYTLLPGRIFGGDNYNPFSNTISIYSDLKAVGLHEAGHAKDTALDDYKGSYAALRMLPFYALVNEEFASGDAISYIQSKKDIGREKRAYKTLYPAFGTYVGGEFLSYVPGIKTAAAIIGAIPGHIVGRIKASKLDKAAEVNQSN